MEVEFMITIAEIKHQEKLVGRHYGAVRRLSKPDGNKALLQKAARAFQEAFRFFDYFNGSAPAHTPSLYQRIQAGELDAIEEAVRFLEADPCCVEAGYIKLKICKALRSAVLPEPHRERLRQVILRNARLDRPMAEFFRYAQLAEALYSPEFAAAVCALPATKEHWRQRRQRLISALSPRTPVPAHCVTNNWWGVPPGIFSLY